MHEPEQAEVGLAKATARGESHCERSVAIYGHLYKLPSVNISRRRYPEHQRNFAKLCKQNPILTHPDSINVVLTLDRL